MSNVDAVNFSLAQIKSLGINAFDRINNTQTSVALGTLAFKKATDDDKVLLQDTLSKSGILMKKISLDSIFPSGISLRPYKKSIYQEQDQITEAMGVKLNTKYSTTLTVVDPNVLNTATSFDKDSVRDFMTFCRVFGFYELTLSDVHLSTVDGKLIISVNSTHDYFTGFIEVLV
jgi:hypothetical protein